MAEGNEGLGFPREPDEPGELSDDAIAGTFRILQRLRGHRYSIDDVITAWEAAQARPTAASCLDLGSGVGSVLLMLAHKLPGARFVAVEAQRISFGLLTQNVARNGLDARVRLVHGDLREVVRAEALGQFELVSGTPPYVPPGAATPSPDAQRAFARQEFRGGIEAYIEAGARVLAPQGRLVVCGDARFPERALAGAGASGLVLTRRRDIVPRAGEKPLFSVFTLAHPGAAQPFEHAPAWVARDAQGARSQAYLDVRAFFDLAAPRS
jgi:tRNA1Val (adenine37-N6)-methyltransferase